MAAYEISLVSIPADTNVGVGRSAIVNNENNADVPQNENMHNYSSESAKSKSYELGIFY
jgi:hypothetical protein